MIAIKTCVVVEAKGEKQIKTVSQIIVLKLYFFQKSQDMT